MLKKKRSHYPNFVVLVFLILFAASITAQAAPFFQNGFESPPSAGANQAPSFASTAITTATVGAGYTYSISTSDPNASDTRTVSSVQTLPGWLTLTPSANGTATLSGTPQAANIGTANIQLRVTDAGGLTADQSFTITVSAAVSTVIISGKVTCDFVPAASPNGLNYGAIVQRPARDVVVQAISGTSTVVASANTDANGNYSVLVPQNTTVIIRVLAQMVKVGTPSWDFKVVDNTNNQALYTLNGTASSSGTANSTRNLNAASGYGGANSGGTGKAYSTTRAAAPFAMLDAIYQSYQKVLAVAPNTQFAPLLVNWSPNNTTTGGNLPAGQIGTSFYNGQLYILGADGNDTDEYDDHVIVHEWGHYFEDKLSRSDSIGGQHSGSDRLDMRLAFGEGWGNALSGIITDDPNYNDTGGANQQTTSINLNVENNSGFANPGWYNESSVQSILYDLYDAANDGGNDTVALGFGPIFNVMIGTQKTTPALTSLFSFIKAVKDVNGAQAAAIDTLVGVQSIAAITDAYGSSATNNAGDANDVLPVYTTLTVGGGTQNVCSIVVFGASNKLSVNRFLRVMSTTAGSYTFTVAGTSGTSQDGVIKVYNQGSLVGSADNNVAGVTENLTINLNATTEYIVEVYEFKNRSNAAGQGKNCFNVSVVKN